MVYRHVFDMISNEFRVILCVFGNFTALRPRKISEALIINSKQTKAVHVAFDCAE